MDVPAAYYGAPNEQLPQKALPFFRKAPPGAYVSVGTERGFIGAANSPAVTHLLLVDADPGAACFNRVNLALLRAAGDRESYLRLRLRAGREEWARAGLDPSLWAWWRAALGFKPSLWNPWSFLRQTSFKNFHNPPNERKGPYRTFDDVNYLFEDALFGRLRAMAGEGKIEVLQADLTDPYALAEAGKKAASMASLSVLDLSNLWYRWHMSNRSLARLLETFDRYAKPESLLLTTARMPLLSTRWIAERLRYGTLIAWDYQAFTFGCIRARSFLPFARSLKWRWITRRGSSLSAGG